MRLMLWGAPRSRSTAFFRMMAERDDFTVAHEPLSYLAEFGQADVGGRRLSSPAELLRALREFPGPVFAKDRLRVAARDLHRRIRSHRA